MEDYRLRPAREADSEVIKSLVRRAGINPLGLDWERFLVAVDGESRLIGCGQVKPHRDGTQELASLVVRPEWRGQGIARALIDALLESHPGPMYLMCRSGLGPLYGKFGFRALTEGNTPRYFRRVKRLSRLAEFFMGSDEFLLIMGRPEAESGRG